jgi:hypothetical protein
MSDSRRALVAPPPVVALAGWLVPGLGYGLIGEKFRGLVIGATVVVMYVGGLLIGGVRVIDVPGYDEFGKPITLPVVDGQGKPLRDEENREVRTWVMRVSPMSQVRDKPWSIAQVMAGPLGVASGAASLWAAGPNADGTGTIGTRSHVRVNEIGTLYTAVAGMLNLLAILDSVGRAGRVNGGGK